MFKKFVIPLNKDDLLAGQDAQYFVKAVLPPRLLSQALDETKQTMQNDGALFVYQHFDTFFSVMVHGTKVEVQVVLRAFSRVTKGIEMLINSLEELWNLSNEIDVDARNKFLCCTNMYAYLLSWLMCHMDERVSASSTNTINIGKKKKATKSDLEDQWEGAKQKALELIYTWLQLPLQKLWQPPIAEDSFVDLFTQICYKTLENTGSKQKNVRQTVFEILACLVKRYNHGLYCPMRIIQLVKMYDTLATPLAVGVAHMVMDCDCKNLIKAIVAEIDENEPGELDSRNILMFFETLSTKHPELLVPVLDDLLNQLCCQHYTMRNCVFGVLGAVIPTSLTGEDLTIQQKDQRDQCLDSLMEHILDINAYVRSKVLQTWQHLCCEGAVPLSRQGKLLAAAALRLEDKSAIVRKNGLQLLRTLLQCNPFASKFDTAELSKSVEEQSLKLKELQAHVTSGSTRGDSERLALWTTLLPKTRAALSQIIHKEQTNEEVEDDEDEDLEQNNKDINPDYAFEHIRQLMLKEKIFEAVEYLWMICTKLQEAPDMKNLSLEEKEECLFVFLLKIFMESEHALTAEETDNNTLENGSQKKDADTEKKQRSKLQIQKNVVNYLKDCLKFARELETAIDLAEKLLFSVVATDAIESCTFLGTAHQFGVVRATPAVRKALMQFYESDESVRTNVAKVYKEIYLDGKNSERSGRQKALACVNGLIKLLNELQPGQSRALTHLVVTWYKNGELNSETQQVLWEIYAMKLPDTSTRDSRAAIMLITMIAQTESSIINRNFDVLIEIGFGPRAKNDLLLARDTCRALLKIKHNTSNIEKAPARYSNDHQLFKELLKLLIDNFTNMIEDGYISFTVDAVGVIYHLANQPEHLIKQLLLSIVDVGHFVTEETNETSLVSSYLYAKLLHLVGHVAISQMVHLESSVYGELKRRTHLRQLKKGNKRQLGNDTFQKSNMTVTPRNASNIRRASQASVTHEDNGGEVLEGAVEDADAEFINYVVENEIVTGNGLLQKFVPLVLNVCRHPHKYDDEDLQAAATLALCKMMTVSRSFCGESLQLLITILEHSLHPKIRATILIGLSDLMIRFPNQIEPLTKHIYRRLRDDSKHVRSTCLRMLTNLIMREMIRVKGQVSELAICIVDKDVEIRENAQQFFQQLSRKGDALYNVMPDMLSCLVNPKLNLDDNDLRDILRFIMGLLQKEKQIDAIIDKVCGRLKSATTEQQWQNLSYCLSLLQFSGKSIHYLIECLPFLKEAIHNKEVLKAFRYIIEQAKKKAGVKDASIELEKKLNELLQDSRNAELNDSQIMPPPLSASKKQGKPHRKSHSGTIQDEQDDGNDDDDDDSGSQSENVEAKRSVQTRKKTPAQRGMSPSSTPKRNKLNRTQEQTERRTSSRLRSKTNSPFSS